MQSRQVPCQKIKKAIMTGNTVVIVATPRDVIPGKHPKRTLPKADSFDIKKNNELSTSTLSMLRPCPTF